MGVYSVCEYCVVLESLERFLAISSEHATPTIARCSSQLDQQTAVLARIEDIAMYLSKNDIPNLVSVHTQVSLTWV